MKDKPETTYSKYGDDYAIDLSRIGTALLHKLWAIILVAVLISSAVYFYSQATYVECYSSNAILAFTTTERTVEEDENGTEIGILTQKKHYTQKDAERYQFLLTSDVMVQKIFDTLAGSYTQREIEESLSVSNTSITGIFMINVTNTDKEFCADAIGVVIDAFPDYLKSFDTELGIDVIKNAKPPVALNESQAERKAFYGFVLGAALIIFVVIIAEVLSDTVKQTQDIRSKIKIKFLGAIPTLEADRKRRCHRHSGAIIVDESKERFAFTESFKAIRTKIESVAAEKGYKLFVVTSTFENEGKTTVAINLACALEQKGRSVLLVECDLRKPSIMRSVGIKDDEKNGLIQIIQGDSTYADSIKFVKSRGIFILPSGGISPKSTEVLDADKVKEVFGKAAAEFDFVIIDTPPAHIVADCLVVAPLADALIYTIKRDYAKISEINETLEEIASADIDIVGCVLTMNNEEGSGKHFFRRGGLYYDYRRRKGRYKGYYM